MTVQIVGVASTPSGKHQESSTRELFTDTALEDTSLSVYHVEERYAKHSIGERTADQAQVSVEGRTDNLSIPFSSTV